MSVQNRINRRRPVLADLIGPHDLRCKFCDNPDLRVGGSERTPYLTCPRCEGDGPPGDRDVGIYGAVHAYQDWPNRHLLRSVRR